MFVEKQELNQKNTALDIIISVKKGSEVKQDNDNDGHGVRNCSEVMGISANCYLSKPSQSSDSDECEIMRKQGIFNF